MKLAKDLQLAAGARLLAQSTMMIMMALGGVMLLAPNIGEKIFYVVYYQDIVPPADFTEEARSYIRFTNAVLGAVMIGWMTLTYRLISARQSVPFPVRSALILSFGSWYVVDTIFSAVHGIWGNVALNTAVAVGILLPLQFGARPGVAD
jgi:hypothetical protein